MTKEIMVSKVIKVDTIDIMDEMNSDEIVEFIKELDEMIGAWDFTEKMARYFVSQMKFGYDKDGLEGSFKKFLKSLKYME